MWLPWTVDSGANDAAGPPNVGAHVPVVPTEASARGNRDSAANGPVRRNPGQRVIWGRNR
eukprot:3567812-Pyramimonas_sp.AAC.1